ncbi:MAG: DUF4956 domain-containing protein [Clostridia bacterium]|nr:DUF4956 domain-containing protein [Clostridia bacterium]
MLNTIFGGLFDSSTTSVISVQNFLLYVGLSLVLGIIMALCYTYKTRYTKSFLLTLAILPAVVCVVIMMVNGNVGTGVAVAGAFSLVRFRSAPGTAKEIAMIFLAMSAGLIAGMGYLAYAVLFTVILCLMFMLYNSFSLGEKRMLSYKTMAVTIPEDLNYTEVFDDILKKYTKSYELKKVKTTNMGSMFRLTYDISLKDKTLEKEMIDSIRERNGNLEISISNQEIGNSEL